MTAAFAEAGGLVRVYPAAQPSGRGLVWAHGGAFTRGDLDMPESDWVARSLAARGTTIVSVDYRLATEAVRYPAPSDDILAAWDWTVGAAERLGIDRTRLAVGGASAGANLVTGAILRLLQTGAHPLPAIVVLGYPTLLAVQPDPGPELRAALDANPDFDRFPAAVVREMYEDLLGAPAETAPLPAVPGCATRDDLVGFPRTLMILSEVDELRISGEAFADTLRAAGRDVTVIVEHGTHHGHLNRPEEAAATASINRIAEELTTL